MVILQRIWSHSMKATFFLVVFDLSIVCVCLTLAPGV